MTITSLINFIAQMPDPFDDPDYHLSASYFNTKEHALGSHICDSLRGEYLGWWFDIFTWGKTSIYKQIETLKIRRII